MVRFLKDIHDPHYVGNLYNINRPKGAPVVQIGEDEKNHFGTFACKQATKKCRIQNQYNYIETPMRNFLEPLTTWNFTLLWGDLKKDQKLG